jgi:hypothetical protein
MNPRPRCSYGSCGGLADTVHFVNGETTPERLGRGPHARYPRAPETTEVRWSCPRHDVGAYKVSLVELGADPFGWLAHLAGKSWRGDLALLEMTDPWVQRDLVAPWGQFVEPLWAASN